MEATHVMEVAQLMLSLIHSWGIDLHLDKVCETQLGLLRPMVIEYCTQFFLSRFKRNDFRIHILTLFGVQNSFLDSSFVWRSIERWLHVFAVANVAK